MKPQCAKAKKDRLNRNISFNVNVVAKVGENGEGTLGEENVGSIDR